MKSVLISIQPYWVFLIIARKMGWKIDQEKTIEVRKSFPKAEDWNKLIEIYCSKDKKSFNLIPKEYQPLMEKFLGKVIGEFTCDKIDEYLCKEYEWEDGDVSLEYHIRSVEGRKTCLEYDEIREYGNEKPLYFWHISDLKIYDKPRELSKFKKYFECGNNSCGSCDKCDKDYHLTRPPQSWQFIEKD